MYLSLGRAGGQQPVAIASKWAIRDWRQINIAK